MIISRKRAQRATEWAIQIFFDRINYYINASDYTNSIIYILQFVVISYQIKKLPCSMSKGANNRLFKFRARKITLLDKAAVLIVVTVGNREIRLIKIG